MKFLSTFAILALINDMSVEGIKIRNNRPYVQSEDPLFSDDGEAVSQSMLSIKSSEKVLGASFENKISPEQMKELIQQKENINFDNNDEVTAKQAKPISELLVGIHFPSEEEGDESTVTLASIKSAEVLSGKKFEIGGDKKKPNQEPQSLFQQKQDFLKSAKSSRIDASMLDNAFADESMVKAKEDQVEKQHQIELAQQKEKNKVQVHIAKQEVAIHFMEDPEEEVSL